MTADKGVALIVIDKADYIKKAEYLLKEDSYKRIPEDPTVTQKNKLINILKTSRQREASIKNHIKDYTQLVQGLQILWAAKNT